MSFSSVWRGKGAGAGDPPGGRGGRELEGVVWPVGGYCLDGHRAVAGIKRISKVPRLTIAPAAVTRYLSSSTTDTGGGSGSGEEGAERCDSPTQGLRVLSPGPFLAPGKPRVGGQS